MLVRDKGRNMLKRLFTIVLLLGVGAGAAILYASPWEETEQEGGAVDRLIAEKVSVRTLTDEITISGEMRREELQSINAASSGRLSSVDLEEGDTIQAGSKLFSLDGRPSVAVEGDFSFYRELSVGSQGPDVEQLETILSKNGYAVGTVDQFFNEETRKGLAEWQKDFGFSGVTSEVEEMVKVSLLSNPSGYKIGAANTVAVEILPANGQLDLELDGRQGTAVVAAAQVPVVTVSAKPSVVVEGGKAVIELSAEPAPPTDIEIEIKFSGEAREEDDYKEIEKKVVIPKGETSLKVEIIILTDTDLEANEELIIELVGQFEDEESVSPQTLKVFDLEFQLDELISRRPEIEEEKAEAKEERDGLQSIVREKTDIEQELLELGILTMLESIEANVSAAQAQELIRLDQILEDANDVLEKDKDDCLAENPNAVCASPSSATAVAKQNQAFNDYYDYLEIVLGDSAELTTAKNLFESLEDELERNIYLVESTREELRKAQAARWIVGSQDEVKVIIDDPQVPDVPVLVLSASSDNVTEPGTALFHVDTTGEMSEDLNIFFEVAGDVEPGVDYNVPSGDVRIAKGTKKTSISITIRDDSLVEDDEILIVRLVQDQNNQYTLSGESEAKVKVISPDLPELKLVGGGRIEEGETAVVTVLADQAATVDTSINYSVTGSAQAGTDYQMLTGSALLRAGETSLDIPVRSLEDDIVFKPGDMIVADWPARVGRVSFDNGDFVQSGSEILNLTEPKFAITLFSSPTDRAKLKTGQEVTVKLDAGGQESEGLITQLDDTASSGRGSELYEGIIETVDELIAVEGAVISIDVVVSEVVDAVVVPIAAVLAEGSDEKVRVVTRDSKIERREIETGMLDGAWVEVIAGVSPGEFVILEIDRS